MNNDYDSNYFNAQSTFDHRFGQTATDNMMPTPLNLQPKLLTNLPSEREDGRKSSERQVNYREPRTPIDVVPDSSSIKQASFTHS